VSCASGAPVVGIWVDAVNGGSGWAKLTPQPGGETRFTKTIDRAGDYQLHVGCGGTEADWVTTYFTTYVGETGLVFVCDDGSGKRRGWCEIDGG
jgi:hypothetical protein